MSDSDDPWFSADPNPFTTDLHRRVSTAISSSSSSPNVDPRLFHDLQEFFPLLQSFLDQETKASSSFTRRSTMVYTKAPSLSNKTRRNLEDKDKGADSIDARRNLVMEADKEDLISLRKQVHDLHKTIQEKDDFLQSNENLNSQISCVQEELVGLKHQSAEKDALLKAVHLQLSDMKIELADKQAAIEKKQWEVMQSNKRIEEFNEAVDCMNREHSLYVQLFEGLMTKDDFQYVDNYDIQPSQVDNIPELDDTQLQNIEEARKSYINAVTFGQRNDEEDIIADAIITRLHLQSLLFRSQGGEPIWG